MNEDRLPGDAAELRRRAEEAIEGTAVEIQKGLEAQSPEAMLRTCHELRVHQIELEMQNEELRRAQIELERLRARYFDLYDLAPIGYCTISERGLILEANLVAAMLLGAGRSDLVNLPITRFIITADQDIYYLHRRHLFETGETQSCEVRMMSRDGTRFWAHLEATTALDDNGAPICRVVMSDITTRKQAEEALQEAFDQIRTLRGILPICMHCRRIRDDQGYWQMVEVYVRDHSEAEFSHSICPKCAHELYAEFQEEDVAAPTQESGLQ